MNTDSIVYARLRDKGTTFNDHTQGVYIVGTRIGRFLRTGTVIDALSKGVLVELKPEKAHDVWVEQQKELGLYSEGKAVQSETTDPEDNGNILSDTGVSVEDADYEGDTPKKPATKGKTGSKK